MKIPFDWVGSTPKRYIFFLALYLYVHVTSKKIILHVVSHEKHIPTRIMYDNIVYACVPIYMRLS